MAELKPCPNCKSKKITLWVIRYPVKRPYQRFFECDKCHWGAATKRTTWGARRAWNRRGDNG